jgi:hypothetical protein
MFATPDRHPPKKKKSLVTEKLEKRVKKKKHTKFKYPSFGKGAPLSTWAGMSIILMKTLAMGLGDTDDLVTGKNSKAGSETLIYHPGLSTSEFLWYCQGSGYLTKCSIASILP